MRAVVSQASRAGSAARAATAFRGFARRGACHQRPLCLAASAKLGGNTNGGNGGIIIAERDGAAALEFINGARPGPEPADVVLLSNGPGEVAAWVRPVVRALREKMGDDRGRVRITVALAPCPHASGQEATLAASYPEVDRVVDASRFWLLLLDGRRFSPPESPASPAPWTWRPTGVVVFLGGDQLNAVLLAKRLGYRCAVYAETDARWPGLADAYLLRAGSLLPRVAARHRHRCRVVGDLYLDAVAPGRGRAQPWTGLEYSPGSNSGTHGPLLVALLPGSKPAKLGLGVPYFLAVADALRKAVPSASFVLPLAPTVTAAEVAAYADPATNSAIERFGWGRAKLAAGRHPPWSNAAKLEPSLEGVVGWLESPGGARVALWGKWPAYELYLRCALAVTTVGTNTAELGALGVPMVVVLPTHSLSAFRGGAGGVLGLLSGLPGILGESVASAVNAALLRSSRFLAWPNMWAGEAVVPELVGRVEPADCAESAAALLSDPARLAAMRSRLLALRGGRLGPGQRAADEGGGGGAAAAVAAEVATQLAAAGAGRL